MRLRDAFYHHRRGYRALTFVLVGALAVGIYAAVVRIPDGSVPGWVLADRKAAVQTALRGQQAIQAFRAEKGLPFDPGDRFRTGLIGVASSPLTTELGILASHRTATEPAFAAAVVQMLYRAGVHPGDLVAVGMTGSYPGLDLDAIAAVEAVHAIPVTISSVSSSAYGANEPRLSWPDIERALFDAGVIRHRSIAVAAGGSLAGRSFQSRWTIASHAGLPVVPVLTTSEEIKYREQLYVQAAQRAGQPIRAFVNVGGAAVNVGSSGAETIIAPGLSRPRWTPFEASRLGVVGFMGSRGIPIIALMDVAKLAKRFGLPWDPHLEARARDIAAPPPDPIAVAVALVLLASIVVFAHRRGLFRVPDWELPTALRRAARSPATAATTAERPPNAVSVGTKR